MQAIRLVLLDIGLTVYNEDADLARLYRSAQLHIDAAAIVEGRFHASAVDPNNAVRTVRHIGLKRIDGCAFGIVEHRRGNACGSSLLVQAQRHIGTP